MFTEETPNPLALKFFIGPKIIPEGTFLFSSLAEVKNIPALEDVFSLPGVDSILLTPEFMTINKTEQVPWRLLEGVILSALSYHENAFPLDLTVINKESSKDEWTNWKPQTEEMKSLFQDIEDIIDSHIRPAVEADGGIINLCGIKDNTAYVRLQGACSSCPHSEETLKSGVQQTLTYYIPEIDQVKLA